MGVGTVVRGVSSPTVWLVGHVYIVLRKKLLALLVFDSQTLTYTLVGWRTWFEHIFRVHFTVKPNINRVQVLRRMVGYTALGR